jgi:hypothetical protein
MKFSYLEIFFSVVSFKLCQISKYEFVLGRVGHNSVHKRTKTSNSYIIISVGQEFRSCSARGCGLGRTKNLCSMASTVII